MSPDDPDTGEPEAAPGSDIEGKAKKSRPKPGVARARQGGTAETPSRRKPASAASGSKKRPGSTAKKPRATTGRSTGAKKKRAPAASIENDSSGAQLPETLEPPVDDIAPAREAARLAAPDDDPKNVRPNFPERLEDPGPARKKFEGSMIEIRVIDGGHAALEDDEDDRNVFERFVDWCLAQDPKSVERYVDDMRARRPDLSNDELAKLIVSRRAMKGGIIGAVLGVGGLMTLPVTAPANIVMSWRIQIFTALAVAYVYGHRAKQEKLRTDLFLILSGDTAEEALKRAGIFTAEEVTRRNMERLLTRETIKRLNQSLVKSLSVRFEKRALARLTPLLGAPVGFAFDWAAAMAAGRAAIRYYGGLR